MSDANIQKTIEVDEEDALNKVTDIDEEGA